MLMIDIDDWSRFYSDIGIEPRFCREYIEYIERLASKDLPPIFESIHLAQLLGIKHDALQAMVFGTSKFYRSFTIRKRSGGTRNIVAPYPSLLNVQRWILLNIISKIEVSRCATGFRKKSSIYRNAELHCSRDVLLKLDIQDFFTSISFRRVMHIFVNIGYSQNVSFLLSRLCTLEGVLPQGAATSPAISNVICETIDDRIYKLCKSVKLRYTRYADDICVSGASISIGIQKLIEEIIESDDFTIKRDKTRLLYAEEKKIVTGLDISSGTPRVTRKFRREIQKDVYFVWSTGLSTHLARRKIFNPNYIEHLIGRVNFWKNIEPTSRQMNVCLERMMKVKEIFGMPPI